MPSGLTAGRSIISSTICLPIPRCRRVLSDKHPPVRCKGEDRAGNRIVSFPIDHFDCLACTAVIPTSRHLEYIQGYLALGLVDDAAAELELIASDERLSDEVLEMSIDVYSMQKRWAAAVAAAQEF